MSANTKGLEEALQALLKGSGGDGSGVGAKDLVAGVVTLISRQLENSEEREDLAAKLDLLTEQVSVLRKMVTRNHKLLRSIHEHLDQDLQVLCEQQTASGEAVLSLAEQIQHVHGHLGRLELIEEEGGEPEAVEVLTTKPASSPVKTGHTPRKAPRRK